MPRKLSTDAKRILFKMLDVDPSKRQRFNDIAEDLCISDNLESKKLHDFKSKNYHLKRVYAKNRSSKYSTIEWEKKDEFNLKLK